MAPEKGLPSRPIKGTVRHTTTFYRPARKPPGPAKRLARKGAPPKGGLMVSKRQHRFAFASKQPWARSAAIKGRYRRLPERKRAPTARTVR